MKELIRRAILGTDIKDLASNIAELGFSPIVCNRIIAGCVKEKDIDRDKVIAKLGNKQIKDLAIHITDNTRDDSLTVEYKTMEVRFTKSGTVVEDRIYDSTEIWNNFETKCSSREGFDVPIKYYEEYSIKLVPEDYV